MPAFRAPCLAGLVLAATACRAPAATRPTRPPNVILVLTDDQGWADLGLLGTPGIVTPHLDRMAAEGARFTDFYAAQPVCSASRAAFLTGCYAQRLGLSGALGPRSPIGIAAEETTLAELLGARGYETALFGKWHLGDAPEFLPTRHGFQRFFGLPYSHDMWPRHPESPDAWGDLPLLEGERVIAWNADPDAYTAAFNARAEAFVREMGGRGQPFFLMLAHPMPHVPLGAGPDFRGRTDGLYGDVLAEIDAGVGRLLAALEETGQTENTLVLFSSDNGPWLSYGNHAGSAGRLREGKGTTFEGGVRVPFLARWPGRIPAGLVVETPAMAIDVLPTVAGFAGAPLPPLAIDGRDLGPLLLGTRRESPHEAYFFTYGRNELQALRAGRWKLHFPHGYRTMRQRLPGLDGIPGLYDYGVRTGLELYDLEADPAESLDVAARHPEVVARLERLADDHRRRLGDELTGTVGRENRAPGRR